MSNYPPPPPPGDPNQPNPYGQQPPQQPPPPPQQPQQPANPYGNQPPANPAHVPPPPGYGQPGFGQPPAYGQPGYGAPGMSPFGQYAGWGTRLAAYLVDALVAVGAALIFIILAIVFIVADVTVLGVLFYIVGIGAAIAVQIWNLVMKQGTTGQSIGKGVMGIKVVGENTGQPLGNGGAFVRFLMHAFVDGAICYLGFLWPLWDDKKQTWGDKVASSVVLQAPKA